MAKRLSPDGLGIGLGNAEGMEHVFKLSTSAGKTLTELVIVTAIVGMLAVMAAPAYQGFQTRLQGRTAVA